MSTYEWPALTVSLCSLLRLVTDVLGALQCLFSSAAQSTYFKSKGSNFTLFNIVREYVQNFLSFVLPREPYFCVFQRYVQRLDTLC